MTRKEQVKILDDKIKANNAQYNLDRMNAEIIAYSSGDLPKYEYLTKNDLGYKPDAFEQAKFEYSLLGKVFTDGLDKSDRKEGLLKRLKNIEDKSNNQLLALRDINRPAIKGRNDNSNDNGNGNGNGNGNDIDIDIDYKKIQDYKKKLIDDGILNKNSVEEFDNIINKWIQTKDKDILYINNENKISARKLDIYNIFYSYLSKDISYKDIEGMKKNISLAVNYYSDENKSIVNNSNKVIKGIDLIILLINNDNLRIPGQYYAKPLDNTNLSWIKNKDEYERVADEAGSDYLKRNNDKELKIIKDFITKINNGKINKSNAASKFKKLKQKVNNDKLKHDLAKYVEKSLFGEGLKILTNKQMLNRLPILLAQIQAGNNSTKLKNEIRQILYSLYRSEVLTKTVYNNLMKSIR